MDNKDRLIFTISNNFGDNEWMRTKSLHKKEEDQDRATRPKAINVNKKPFGREHYDNSLKQMIKKRRTRDRRKGLLLLKKTTELGTISLTCKALVLLMVYLLISVIEGSRGQQQANSNRLPDLVSSTSDEPIVAIIGQDAFVSCVAKNLQNYTIIWRFTNDANAPGADNVKAQQTTTGNNKQESNQEQSSSSRQAEELGVILSAGRQRVVSDDRFSVIQSHDTWLLKISNVRLSDTGTYICHTNSEPRVRVLRILSVIKPNGSSRQDVDAAGWCFDKLQTTLSHHLSKSTN